MGEGPWGWIGVSLGWLITPRGGVSSVSQGVSRRTFGLTCSQKAVYLYLFYAGTSLSCAGIQQWKSVLFCCWAAINLVGKMSNEEQDTTPPTLLTLFLPHCVKSSTSLLALDEQWGVGYPTPYPTHPFPSSLYEEFSMSDNMYISFPPAAVPAYWDPGGSARFRIRTRIIILDVCSYIARWMALHFSDCTKYTLGLILFWKYQTVQQMDHFVRSVTSSLAYYNGTCV